MFFLTCLLPEIGLHDLVRNIKYVGIIHCAIERRKSMDIGVSIVMGYPTLWRSGKSIYKWMIGGTPIFGNLHTIYYLILQNKQGALKFQFYFMAQPADYKTR